MSAKYLFPFRPICFPGRKAFLILKKRRKKGKKKKKRKLSRKVPHKFVCSYFLSCIFHYFCQSSLLQIYNVPKIWPDFVASFRGWVSFQIKFRIWPKSGYLYRRVDGALGNKIHLTSSEFNEGTLNPESTQPFSLYYENSVNIDGLFFIVGR